MAGEDVDPEDGFGRGRIREQREKKGKVDGSAHNEPVSWL